LRSSARNDVVLERLGITGDPDGNGAIDARGDDTLADGEDVGEGDATGHELAGEVALVNGGVECGGLETELSSGLGVGVGHREDGIGNEPRERATRNERSSNSQDLIGGQRDIESLGDRSTSLAEDVEHSLVAGLHGEDGGSRIQQLGVIDESSTTEVSRNSNVLNDSCGSSECIGIGQCTVEVEVASGNGSRAYIRESAIQEGQVGGFIRLNASDQLDGEVSICKTCAGKVGGLELLKTLCIELGLKLLENTGELENESIGSRCSPANGESRCQERGNQSD